MNKEKEYENLIDYDDEGNSNCCNAPIIRGFCSACKEHAKQYERWHIIQQKIIWIKLELLKLNTTIKKPSK